MVKSEVAALDQKMDKVLSSFNSSNIILPIHALVITVTLHLTPLACDITSTSLPLGSFLNPAASCKNTPTSSPSGNYWIQSTCTSTGHASLEYCDKFPPFNQSRTSGWMRVAQLNMTDPQEHCPSGFRTITSPKRMCGRSSGPGCASTTFSVNGVDYNKICGKVIGYQYCSMDAFHAYSQHSSLTIDDVYVDGVSLTHGQSPRQHIWTFANAQDEVRSSSSVCPCTKNDSDFAGVVPRFIGNDYFCATGSHKPYSNTWYTADPLWDGEGCGGSSTCCGFNNPPWFCKDLESTTDDIELRLCRDQNSADEDIGLELVEIYVQ